MLTLSLATEAHLPAFNVKLDKLFIFGQKLQKIIYTLNILFEKTTPKLNLANL
jgi:hypothetical protein